MSGVSVQTVEVPTYRATEGGALVSESQVNLKDRPELQMSSYHAPLVVSRHLSRDGKSG
jgi:hypothetical protein